MCARRGRRIRNDLREAYALQPIARGGVRHMRGTQLFVAAVFAVSVAACGHNGARDDGTPGAAGTSGRGNTALSMGERNFVQDQLKDGSREVRLGELAEKNAASADVKQFARM